MKDIAVIALALVMFGLIGYFAAAQFGYIEGVGGIYHLFQDSLGKWVNLAVFIVVLITIGAIFFRFDNASTILAWIFMLITFPIVGLIGNLYLSREYLLGRKLSQKEDKDLEYLKKSGVLENDYSAKHDTIAKEDVIQEKMNIVRMLSNNCKALLTDCNKITLLNNGKVTYDALLKAIEAAKEHINIEYYIIENDVIGNKVKDALIKKAKEGVEVRLIYDGLGSWGMGGKFKRQLKDAGVQITTFRSVSWLIFATKINFRNHRKIAVMDGKIAFVGGINIGDNYIKDPELGFWRDTHLQIEGEAAQSLQAIFLADWLHASREKNVDVEKYLKIHRPDNKQWVQIAASGPDSEWSSTLQAFFAAITTAKEYVYIATPYFIPTESISTALCVAALSGVDVRIILPKDSDSSIVKWGTRFNVGQLLEAGVRVFYYAKGFIHSKVMVVDDVFGSVGTANMDIRSFDQNLEVNALLYDKKIVAELKKSFQEDLTYSEEVTLKDHQNRPYLDRVKERAANMVSPLL
ncbi:MAG: cardiolipin synthase [Chitinophagales bacterium]